MGSRGAAFVGAMLVGCSSGGGSSVDAGGVEASGANDTGGCPTTIAAYCANHTCPKTPAEAIAMLCAGSPEVVTCGNSVASWRIDVGDGYDFDMNASASCVAGPTDAAVALCPATTPSICPHDGGSD
jgi:hypothetical protein